MKVALVNKNPAVSRLITLSLDKIGADYIQVADLDEIGGGVNFLIIDSDIDVGDFDLKQIADKVMYLMPRGLDRPEFADVVLEKPFLPTDFIKTFEQNKPSVSENLQSSTGSGLQFHTEISDGIDFELTELDDENSLNLSSENLDEEFELTNLESFDDMDSELDSGFDMVDELKLDESDDTRDIALDDKIEFSELDELTEEEPKEETKEAMQDNTLLDAKDDELEPLAEIENLDELNLDTLEAEDSKELESGIDFDELKTAVDEIDSMQDDFVDDVEQPLTDISFDDSGNMIEPDSIENIKNILDDIDSDEVDDLNLEQPQDNQAIDDLSIQSEVFKIEKIESEKEFINEDIVKDYLMSGADVKDISEIDESTMMAAFGIDNVCKNEENLKAESINSDDIKDELSKKITEHLIDTLNESSIKEALKDMNIKINISFEEK